MRPMTESLFLKDVSTHKMKVLLDSGLYRHLKFRKTGANNWHMWFEIMTWPGTLEIHGDMGTWSFSRIEDMFEFFRTKPTEGRTALHINPSYWQEKINAESRHGGPARKFDIDVFQTEIFDSLDNYDLSRKKKSAIIKALKEEVFNEEDEDTVRMALDRFKHEGFTLSDVWEISGLEYTYCFLWCCYAIAWGIWEYDKMKKAIS